MISHSVNETKNIGLFSVSETRPEDENSFFEQLQLQVMTMWIHPVDTLEIDFTDFHLAFCGSSLESI